MKNSTWLGLVAVIALGACGGGTTGGATGGGGTGGSGSGSVNGCDEATTTVSAGDVTITFPMAAAPAQYSPACVKVHKGATVTWSGAFADHPLTPDDTTGPITATSSGTTATFTFASTGSFGFHCAFHPSIMLGAVFVVP